MSKVRSQISISLDGYVAGPDQSIDNPLGVGGLRLHEWLFPTEAWLREHGAGGGERTTDSAVVEDVVTGVGAQIMGRNMFTAGRGAWDESWRGWWGENPPFHIPVFVLTHHERAPLSMEGGTTYTFVTDGVESALSKARAAAGDRDVLIAGGVNAIQQFIAGGLLDELYLHIVGIVLGAGERLLDNVGDPQLEPLEVVASPAVTHVRYRIDYGMRTIG